MYYNPRAADVNQGENLLSAKEGFAALNRRMLPAGRLLVSCRTSGSLNRPLAALTSGALDPLSRVYLKNSLRLHHGVFSAISASENLDLAPLNLRFPSLN